MKSDPLSKQSSSSAAMILTVLSIFGPLQVLAGTAAVTPVDPAKCVGTALKSGDGASKPPPPVVLPTTLFKAEIRPDATGATKSVWIIAPPAAAGAAPAEADLGPLSVIPAGTQFFHWEDPASPTSLTRSRDLPDEQIKHQIMNAPSTDVEGGGEYLSTDPVDSAQFGSAVVAMTLSHDAQAVTAGWQIENPHVLDFVLSLRNAGITAIRESNKPTWYNFIRAGYVENIHALDAQALLSMVAKKDPLQGVSDVLILDQKNPIQLKDWPMDLLPSLRHLVNGQQISDAQKAVISKSVENNLQIYDFVLAPGSDFNQTPVFKAINGVFSALHNNQGIYQILNSDQ